MRLPKDITSAVTELGRGQMDFVADTYGGLSKGAVRRKVIPIYQRIDKLVQDATTRVACSAGCDFCCHYHIYVTPVEVFTIVEEVQRWSHGRRNELLGALRTYVAGVSGLGRLHHEKVNIACSFLDQGRCGIYPIRPLACRRHHSVERAICERAFHDPESVLPMSSNAGVWIAGESEKDLMTSPFRLLATQLFPVAPRPWDGRICTANPRRSKGRRTGDRTKTRSPSLSGSAERRGCLAGWFRPMTAGFPLNR